MSVLKKKIKRIIEFILNKDVLPDDIPYYHYLTNEDLKYGQVEVKENEEIYIEEVFEYNARATKARIIYKDVQEAKKGYFKINLIFILIAVVLMEVYNLLKLDNFSVKYGYQVICVFAAVYLYSRLFKKFNMYLNVLSTLGLVIVHKAFVVAIVVNILLCYLYDRSRKKIMDELGYPDFPPLDLMIQLKNGQGKKIFSREME